MGRYSSIIVSAYDRIADETQAVPRLTGGFALASRAKVHLATAAVTKLDRLSAKMACLAGAAIGIAIYINPAR